MDRAELPERGFVFWPVGNGDSVTILVGEDLRTSRETVVQVDLHHMAQAEDDTDPHVAVIDRLEEILPIGDDGRPYLSVFALTHPDQDHCRGFTALLERVTIGELWFTPRVFREKPGELCDDATAFRTEAHRRVDIATKSVDALQVDPGDRIRVVGHDDIFAEEPYASLPETMRSIPGHRVSFLDGYDYGGTFSAFIHAPFKDDADGERNDTSLALQVTLEDGDCVQKALLFGDLAGDVIARIFECSQADDVAWSLLLAPHHCSKHAIFDDEDNVRDDVVDGLKNNAELDAWIVSSSRKFPSVDEDGASPPHLAARSEYESIVTAARFVATGEHGDPEQPEPIVIAVGDGCGYQKPGAGTAASALAAAVVTSRPRTSTPRRPTRYGQ